MKFFKKIILLGYEDVVLFFIVIVFFVIFDLWFEFLQKLELENDEIDCVEFGFKFIDFLVSEKDIFNEYVVNLVLVFEVCVISFLFLVFFFLGFNINFNYYFNLVVFDILLLFFWLLIYIKLKEMCL